MKNVVILFMILGGIITGVIAQPQKMNAFISWQGQWKGTSSIQHGPGEPQKAAMEETVQYKLDGTLIIIEGIGKTKPDKTPEEIVVHHAVAILWYDQVSDTYKLKSYLKDGQSTDAWFNVVEDNKYAWGFEVKDVRMRYFITLDPKQGTWHETGEFSRDGKTWVNVFEMSLEKVE